MATDGPFHGKAGTVYVGTAPGSTQVAAATAWDYSESGNEVDSTAGGDTAKSYLAGLSDGSGSVTCHWDPGDSTGQESISIGDSVVLNLLPASDNTEPDADEHSYLTGTVTVTEISRDWSFEGIPGFSFNFRGFLTLVDIDAS